tara:strand:- start:287 stop:1159 length:873 start_codon:yes stop_codon:yes gene_type:complete
MVKGLFTLFLTLLSLISLKNIHFLGELMGFLLSILPNSARNNTKINLKLCFPNSSDQEIKVLMRKSLKETSRSLLESGKSWITFPKTGVANLIQVEGMKLVSESLIQEKGAILFTSHLGNIEVLISFLAENFKCTIPYTPAKINAVDELMKQARLLMGAEMVKADSGGVKSALKALNRGEVIIMASDQVPKKKSGIISNFFGTPALSVSLVSSLATRTESPCHSVSCIRLKKGKGYKVIFSKRIEKLNTLGVPEGVNLMNTELEECIMKAPEQYAWEYKRFKHSNFKNPY